MLDFTHDDIKNETDAGSYQRGLSYFKQDRVISLNATSLNDKFFSIFSEVEGSGHSFYKQKILVHNTHGHIGIRGQCDCPVGFNCKHVVLLLEHFRY